MRARKSRKKTDKSVALDLAAVLLFACACGARSDLLAPMGSNNSGGALATGGTLAAGACSAGGCRPGRVVLFGENSSESIPRDDTWTFDGTRWADVPATTPQPARVVATMATLGNEVVVFGGDDLRAEPLDRPLADTWAFDGTSWRKVPVTTAPPAREYATMATLGNSIVLFGGWNGTTNLNDTWMFDGTSWHPVLVSTHPPTRCFAMMATLGNEVVLFGGEVAEKPIEGLGDDFFAARIFGDTWTFDGTSWTEVTGSNGPPARADGMMATLGNEVVVFGGD
ncbi:MAG: hypothetical protein FWD17_03010, partial [Polyangiaceae bacterium]|nr:hypothetical protein [Polyangiaceae bacterium]